MSTPTSDEQNQAREPGAEEPPPVSADEPAASQQEWIPGVRRENPGPAVGVGALHLQPASSRPWPWRSWPLGGFLWFGGGHHSDDTSGDQPGVGDQMDADGWADAGTDTGYGGGFDGGGFAGGGFDGGGFDGGGGGD